MIMLNPDGPPTTKQVGLLRKLNKERSLDLKGENLPRTCREYGDLLDSLKKMEEKE